ncbi:vacuolar protein sorting 39 [Oratosquilla oratoria]|uniref:vacuolar protein sorting 39 n=1 Tax=Oratosquilla oratoria TaxID=337810 RepID=UPI003F772C35
MHDAYEAIPILEKLPLQIEAITAYDGNLVVGTKQGHLLMYSVTRGTTQRWQVTLLRSNKNFSRKPVTKVAVVPEHQILISLSDNIVSVHDLTVFNFPLLRTMTKTKGANVFELDVKHHISRTGETVVIVRLVVSVRRKLQLYYWKSRQFQELREELTLPDTPRALSWCKEAIAVAFKHEYWLVKLTGEQKELFSTGRNQEPQITRLEDGHLALARDEKTIFLDDDGIATCSYTLNWPEQPYMMVYDRPYLLAVLPKSVEIQTQEPRLSVQSLQLDKPRLLALSKNSKGPSQVFVASTSHVWCLHANPVSQQIPQLLIQKEFELALKLVDLWDEAPDAKQQMNQHIQRLLAFHHFSCQRFQEAMNLFFELNTELLYVIGLYPDLVPEEYRSRLQYPSTPPVLLGTDLENALQALIHYLLQVRHQLVGGSGGVSKTGGLRSTEGSVNIKSRHQMLQIIDTTLLKCYLQTNDALIVPLLRMPDSRVSIEEGERVLRKANKYQELVLLLQTKGLHQKALELLLRHSKRPDSPLKGHQRIISYLQHLGPNQIDLIFEYSGHVIKIHSEDALSIFTGDEASPGEVEHLPRPKVLSFLRKNDKSLVVPYLEYVIHEWKDTNALLHNELIYQYKEQVMEDFRSVKKSEDPTTVETLKMKAETMRKKLLDFLHSSKHYAAATILVHFPYDDLYEERTILLGRLGQHQQALGIYVHTLKDTHRALEYCKEYYSPDKQGKDVYLVLLKLLVSPRDASVPGITNVAHDNLDCAPNTEDIEEVLSLLQNYSKYIDIGQALAVLPDEVCVRLLRPFLHSAFQHATTQKRNLQIARGLTQSLKLQTTEKLVASQSQKVLLSEFTICAVCHKRFTKHSAFVWYPNGDIVHFSCQDRRGH